MAYTGLGTISSMKNSEISQAVIDKLPEETFSSVKTSSVQHFFAGSGVLKCREITLQRTTISCAFEAIKCFFLNLFFPEAANIRYNGYATSNSNKLEEFILGNGKDEEDVKTAFLNCRIVKIYISEDSRYADIEVIDSKMFVTCKICGQIGRNFLLNPSNSEGNPGSCIII